MLILRALGSLFLGLTVAALDGPSLSRPDIKVHAATGRRFGTLKSANGDLGGSGNQARDYENYENSQTIRLHGERDITLSPSARRKARQNPNQADETTALPRVCQRKNGTTLACPERFGCCISSDGETVCCPEGEENSISQLLSAS